MVIRRFTTALLVVISYALLINVMEDAHASEPLRFHIVSLHISGEKEERISSYSFPTLKVCKLRRGVLASFSTNHFYWCNKQEEET